MLNRASGGAAAASVEGTRSRIVVLTAMRSVFSLSSVRNVNAHGPLGDAMMARPEMTLRLRRVIEIDARFIDAPGASPSGIVENDSRVLQADLCQI